MYKYKKLCKKKMLLIFLFALLPLYVTGYSYKSASDNPPSKQIEKETTTGNNQPNKGLSNNDKGNVNKSSTGDKADNSLSGKVIFIDPGHQAKPDFRKEPIAPGSKIMKEMVSAGTVGVKTHVPEHKLNLEVSLELRNELIKRGARVVMSRDTENVDISNVERAMLANKANADIAVRIHADGSGDNSVKGISILIPGKKYVNNTEMLNKSKLAATFTLKSLIASTGALSRGIMERDDITGFNWSKIPVFLIEMGFMTNPHEDTLLNDPGYQDKIVSGIANGLKNYFSSL